MERLIQSHKTPITKKDYRILKRCLIVAQMHAEVIALFLFLREYPMSFFASIEFVVICVLFFQWASKPLWKKFERNYDIVPDLSAADEIEARVKSTVRVREMA